MQRGEEGPAAKGTAAERGRKDWRRLRCFLLDWRAVGSTRQGARQEARLSKQGRARWEPPTLLPEISTPWAFVGTDWLDSVSQSSPHRSRWPRRVVSARFSSPSTLPRCHKMAEPSPGVIHLTVCFSCVRTPSPFYLRGQDREGPRCQASRSSPSPGASCPLKVVPVSMTHFLCS